MEDCDIVGEGVVYLKMYGLFKEVGSCWRRSFGKGCYNAGKALAWLEEEWTCRTCGLGKGCMDLEVWSCYRRHGLVGVNVGVTVKEGVDLAEEM